MKKRMFITTIVMMLVLAIALTTSSLAWFSSANPTVTASAATFTATTSGSSNINLKVSQTTSSWGNQIVLQDGSGRTMVGMIPQTALVAEEGTGTAPTFTGVDINGTHINVTHANYVWPARIAFNSALVNDESQFVIDKDATDKDANGNASSLPNGVTNYANVADASVTSTDHYYYEEFYIHNADAQSQINKLTFQVTGSGLSTIQGDGKEASDYTCNGYAAFILFDAVRVSVGETIPSNALDYAGYQVIATSGTPEGNQIAETSDGNGYLAWVPFAAFTIVIDKTGDTGSNSTNQAWQFADLDAKNNTPAFTYNGANINSLKTQEFDGKSGTGENDGYVIDTAGIKKLNDKVVNGSGNVTNTNTARDNETSFSMQAGETFKVAFYFWLDGYTMTSFTDTTVANVGIKISAAQ